MNNQQLLDPSCYPPGKWNDEDSRLKVVEITEKLQAEMAHLRKQLEDTKKDLNKSEEFNAIWREDANIKGDTISMLERKLAGVEEVMKKKDEEVGKAWDLLGDIGQAHTYDEEMAFADFLQVISDM